MNSFRLRKARSKQAFDRDLPSALWEVVEAPKLYLSRYDEAPDSSHNQLCWLFIANQCSSISQKALRDLAGQRFRTRREALQALEVVMLLEEDDK